MVLILILVVSVTFSLLDGGVDCFNFPGSKHSSSKLAMVNTDLDISYETAVDMCTLAALVYAIPIGQAYKNEDAKSKIEKDQDREQQEKLVEKINTMATIDEKDLDENEYKIFLASTYEIDMSAQKPEIQELLNELRFSPQGRLKKFIADFDVGLQCAVTVSEKYNRVTVVFRGSDDSLDWKANLNFPKTRPAYDPEVQVHRGFNNILDASRDRIFAVIDEIISDRAATSSNKYDIYVTGHSLGGALTTLFGYELSLRYSDLNINAVSFASPRAGNSAFRERHDARTNLKHYRFANNRDTVTSLGWIDFKHVGQAFHLTDDGCDYFPNYNYGWYLFSLANCFKISDHFMPVYWRRLKLAQERITKATWMEPKVGSKIDLKKVKKSANEVLV